MKGEGQQPIFGFFGPAWLINYTMAPNCGGEAVGEGTYGDWAICEPPIGFFWGVDDTGAGYHDRILSDGV